MRDHVSTISPELYSYELTIEVAAIRAECNTRKSHEAESEVSCHCNRLDELEVVGRGRDVRIAAGAECK